MQFNQKRPLLVVLAMAISSATAFAQSTFLQQGSKDQIILERLEIKAQKDSVLNFSKNRYLTRRYAAGAVGRWEQHVGMQSLSKTDAYNIQGLLQDNIEELPDSVRLRLASRKPLGRFYQTPSNLYEVHIKDFDLVINPVIQFRYMKESGNDETLFQNTRGLALRGRISNKIGFAAYLTENQERDPFYVQAWEDSFKSVPGGGYYKNFKGTGFDYFDARGYFTFNAAKYIDITFGYDRNFIGNGYRSLFLSDFSQNTLFLKLNTRIWKFNYQNIFMELTQTEPRAADRLLRKKYAAMHHLDVQLTKSINVGLFEGVVFGRSNRFEFGYLVPVIFYRSIEQQNGSFDNSVAGLDFKANIRKQFQVYGQFLLDEFNLAQIKRNDGWWANKWGLQLGAKYIDAFGIDNLDLQVEMNRVRPFTYSHRDSVANYTHYNQPLAHPLGANFNEVIAILRYQPAPRWTILGKLMSWKQGLNIGAQSYGSNIFLPNIPPFRVGDYGYEIGSGTEAKTMYGSFLLSYELRPNLFIEAQGVYRKFDVPSNSSRNSSAKILSVGVRWNAFRREFEF